MKSKMRIFLGRGGKPGQIVVCSSEKGYVEYKDAAKVDLFSVSTPLYPSLVAPNAYDKDTIQNIINTLASKINELITWLNKAPEQN